MLSSLGWSKPFSMPKAAGMQFLLRIRNSPGALALRDARTSDNDSLCRAGLSIEEFGDLSIVFAFRQLFKAPGFSFCCPDRKLVIALPNNKDALGFLILNYKRIVSLHV